ncbi:MAG: FAD-dependent oxidoreductase [Actinobacteria bacterium]|nr:FAD-dependent oxidoreductase [Actinomycetota bacterium]
MRARVAETREVAKGTLLVRFAVEGYPNYRPGSYFWVELPDRGHQDEKGLRRHISLVTSPTESGVVGLATRLRDTAFKRTLAELEVGDEVEVEEPKGSFLLPEDTDADYVFVAGGIGITVFRSMLRYIADEQQPYRVTLVYSNRDRESAAFLDELEELERRIEGLRVALTMTEDRAWEGENRRIDATMLRDVVGDLSRHHFLVAGPPPMAEGVAAALLDAGVPEEQVVADKFSGY